MTRIPAPHTRRFLPVHPGPFRLCCLFLLALLSAPICADTSSAAAKLSAGYIDAWKAFYPSQAFAYGARDSAAAFEDYRGERVHEWLQLNARITTASESLLSHPGLTLDERTDLLVLNAQSVDEQAKWREDEPLARQPQWYTARGQVCPISVAEVARLRTSCRIIRTLASSATGQIHPRAV